MNRADRENWRLAFIESFREWGIKPRGGRPMAEESLLWLTHEEIFTESARSHQAIESLFMNAPPTQGADSPYANRGARRAVAPSGGDDILKPTQLSRSRFDT